MSAAPGNRIGVILDTGGRIQERHKVFGVEIPRLMGTERILAPDRNLGSAQWTSGPLRTKVPLAVIGGRSVIPVLVILLTSVNIRLAV